MNDVLLQYGLAGVVIIGMATAIIRLWKYGEKKDKQAKEEREAAVALLLRKEEEHKKERDQLSLEHRQERIEWRSAMEKQFEKQEQRDKDHLELLNDLKFLLQKK